MQPWICAGMCVCIICLLRSQWEWSLSFSLHHTFLVKTISCFPLSLTHPAPSLSFFLSSLPTITFLAASHFPAHSDTIPPLHPLPPSTIFIFSFYFIFHCGCVSNKRSKEAVCVGRGGGVDIPQLFRFWCCCSCCYLTICQWCSIVFCKQKSCCCSKNIFLFVQYHWTAAGLQMNLQLFVVFVQ